MKDIVAEFFPDYNPKNAPLDSLPGIMYYMGEQPDRFRLSNPTLAQPFWNVKKSLRELVGPLADFKALHQTWLEAHGTPEHNLIYSVNGPIMLGKIRQADYKAVLDEIDDEDRQRAFNGLVRYALTQGGYEVDLLLRYANEPAMSDLFTSPLGYAALQPGMIEGVSHLGDYLLNAKPNESYPLFVDAHGGEQKHADVERMLMMAFMDAGFHLDTRLSLVEQASEMGRQGWRMFYNGVVSQVMRLFLIDRELYNAHSVPTRNMFGNYTEVNIMGHTFDIEEVWGGLADIYLGIVREWPKLSDRQQPLVDCAFFLAGLGMLDRFVQEDHGQIGIVNRPLQAHY